MRSPVLPGFNADPNIARFGDTYYIYATTDGFAGWGGKEFYVWSSTNLVDWERSAAAVPDLDGANGNVPWATGNAWAPTIIERDGKYYFYFSGHNAGAQPQDHRRRGGGQPRGPFTAAAGRDDPQQQAVTSGQAIDPAVFTDDDGQATCTGATATPVYAELSRDMVSLEPGTDQARSAA